MILPNLESAKIYARNYANIAIYKKISYDNTSVLDIYAAVRGPYSFLIESREQAYPGHYSIITLPCKENISSDGICTQHTQDGKVTTTFGNPMEYLETLLQHTSPLYPELPVFTGGAIGHFNYDVARLYEQLPDRHASSLGLPMMRFGFARELFLIDHQAQELYIIVNIKSEHLEANYANALIRIDELHTFYQAIVPFKQANISTTTLKSNMHKEAFETMVEKGKAYIQAGDIFQVVLSQRFESNYDADPLNAYATLRQQSVSPYMYYLDFEDYVVAGVSPELLLQARGNDIKTMPIAGTRKRGKTAQEDDVLRKDLMNDSKENAEHMMLVDLGRNDIGKVANIGSVQVKKMKEVMYYSHVMHMVSEVHGILRSDCSTLQALASLLPAGTLSGAPKIRAMEIIEELEPCKREIYGGAIGILAYNQQFDTCITIRTFIFHQKKVYIQAGAGIVKDSIPEKEYQETLQKAAGLFAAIGHEVSL